MNPPDTIYIGSYAESILRNLQRSDTDIGYVRADLLYELSKKVEAQRAEIERLTAMEKEVIEFANQYLDMFALPDGRLRGPLDIDFAAMVSAAEGVETPCQCNNPQGPP